MKREKSYAGDVEKAKRTRHLRRCGGVLVAILLVTAILLVFLRDCASRKTVLPGDVPGPSITMPEDTVDTINEDTVVFIKQDSIKDTSVETPPPLPIKKKVVRRSDSARITISTPPASDSISTTITSADTGSSHDTATGGDGLCRKDTTELWVYPDPSGGLHYSSLRIVFVANKPATIHYRTQTDSTWHRYNGTAVVVDTSTTLYYDAIDSCGNVMERRSEYYEIDKKRSASPCHPDMEQIKVGTMNFCIDRYEWPNRKGRTPQSFVSLYQAMDSCFSVQKRLCTSEEWAIACSGPYSSKYPYGQQYERYACSTHDTTVRESGSKPECRSFFGVYDMSGNLLEWTTTKSVENSSFYYVMGGFWESGPKSGCFDKRYSYYPQNQHNPVGFRCCRDLISSPAQPSAIGK